MYYNWLNTPICRHYLSPNNELIVITYIGECSFFIMVLFLDFSVSKMIDETKTANLTERAFGERETSKGGCKQHSLLCLYSWYPYVWRRASIVYIGFVNCGIFKQI
jgi:hypothetical protein